MIRNKFCSYRSPRRATRWLSSLPFCVITLLAAPDGRCHLCRSSLLTPQLVVGVVPLTTMWVVTGCMMLVVVAINFITPGWWDRWC